LLLTC
ncbi:hypothetical protein D046_5497B, partial [Vibrio parahaemolyticus V-223/04]